MAKAKDLGRSGADACTPHEGSDGKPRKRKGDDFTSVALARVTYDQDVLPQKSSAFQYHQSTTGSASHETENGSLVNDALGETRGESGESGSSDFVVVANAECELTHPRPSRSSDKKMIKVLCKSCRETSDDQDDGRRESHVSFSEGSTSSFYTAPVSTPVC